jgi:predicted nuclease with TOPRIM domain
MLYKPSFGQVTKESYEKAVDILNYQSVYYSLSVLSPTSGVTAKFKTFCNCENSPSFEKIKSSIPITETKTTEISDKIQELKNQDISTFDQSRALDFLLNSSFNESTILKDFRSQLEQKRKLFDFRANLTQQLERALQENIQVNTSSQEESDSKLSAIDDRIRTIEKNQNTKEEKSGILGGYSDYLVLLAIVLGIVGLFLSLRKRNNHEKLLTKILESRRLKDMIQSQNNSTSGATRHNNSTSSEIREIQGIIRSLESQINRLNKDIEKLKQPKSNYPSRYSTADQEVISHEPKAEILFLSTPNSDGSFNESSASNTYKDGASIYRLIKTGSANAKFQIDEKESSIKLALQYPDKNIDPVCDAENAFNPRANRISTIKIGEAELQNGKWIINSKAVIRYED